MSKEKAAAEAPPEALPAKTEKLMYIGPTIINPVLLSHRSVFNGLPVFLERQSREIKSALADCFVPLSQSAAALRELEGGLTPGPITEKFKRAQRLLRSAK